MIDPCQMWLVKLSIELRWRQYLDLDQKDSLYPATGYIPRAANQQTSSPQGLSAHRQVSARQMCRAGRRSAPIGGYLRTVSGTVTGSRPSKGPRVRCGR